MFCFDTENGPDDGSLSQVFIVAEWVHGLHTILNLTFEVDAFLTDVYYFCAENYFTVEKNDRIRCPF